MGSGSAYHGRGEGVPVETVCFHCQQVAEKYVKSLLTLWSIQAPRSHDLMALAALLPSEAHLSVTPDQLGVMNPYAVDIRYSDDLPEPRRSDAIRSLELGGKARTEARLLLPPEALVAADPDKAAATEGPPIT